jgi:thiamine biosynthesis lipoprotein
MGTRATLTVVGTPIERITGKLGRASGRALAEIAAIERLMSIYRAESDIGRLNRDGESREVAVDPRTFEVLGRAAGFARLTGGAFNVCVLPAEEAWGFKTGRGRRVPAVPVRGGSDVAMRTEAGRRLVRFPQRGTRVDLGGIAAGYAVDRAVEILRAGGVRGALVDIGGDVYCLGLGARGEPWRVGIRHPRGQEVLTVLSLSDRAVATSGDYEDYFIQDGKRYSHIFDPRTGRPAERGVVSATVIADSCITADALGTALVVMGAKEALRLVERMPRTECILVTEENGELRVQASAGHAAGRKK